VRRSVLLVVAVLGAGFIAGPADAVLCKSRKGGLVVRDECKPSQVALDEAELGALGLRGPKGDAGPPGLRGPQGGPGGRGEPGPMGTGLAVVDAKGDEVGLVTRLNVYYGTSVAREISLPGGPGPEWFFFVIDATGFRKVRRPIQLLYAAPTCTGPEYSFFDRDYWSGAVVHEARVQPDGVTATFVRESEVETAQYYGVESLFQGLPGGTPLPQRCTNPPVEPFAPPPGVVTRNEYPCDSGTCLDCCRPTYSAGIGPIAVDAGPVHRIDLDGLGLTPPFQLTRKAASP
jgi:hypothetical protein